MCSALQVRDVSPFPATAYSLPLPLDATANGDYKYQCMTTRQPLLKFMDQKFDVSPFLKAPEVPFHVTAHGAIFDADCMKLMRLLRDEVVDTVFADPPFNLGKEYGKNTDDSLPEERYVRWCQEWLAECVRVLKPGGSLFLYNLPKWNILLGAFLCTQGLEFRHWIAVEMSACLPIPGPSASEPLQLALLQQGKGKNFLSHPHANSYMPALRW